MNKLKELKNKGLMGLAALLLAIAGAVIGQVAPNLGSATSGLEASIASSTIPVLVGPQQVITLFSANTICAARVISTVNQPIMLSFSTSTSAALRNKPNGSYGLIQGASTTVNYDSGTFGCSEVTAHGADASTTITTLELR